MNTLPRMSGLGVAVHFLFARQAAITYTRVILLTASSVCYSTVPPCLTFGRSRVTLAVGTGSGCQPAMVRTCCRTFSFSVMPGSGGAVQWRPTIRILFKDGTDRGSIGVGDNEHGRMMAAGAEPGNDNRSP